MELIMIIGDRSPGLVQRIIIELGRRGIESEKMFMVHEGDKTKIIVEANVGKMNGRLLHALLGLRTWNRQNTSTKTITASGDVRLIILPSSSFPVETTTLLNFRTVLNSQFVKMNNMKTNW